MTSLRRTVIAPLAAGAQLSTVAACSSDSSTDTGSASSTTSTSDPRCPPSGFPGSALGDLAVACRRGCGSGLGENHAE